MAKRYIFADWTYHTNEFKLTHSSGHVIQLEPRLGRLLELFCANHGEVLSKETIIDELWAPRVVSEESLTVAISQIRRQFKKYENTDFIKTVPGQGYAWKPTTRRVEADRQSSTRFVKLGGVFALSVAFAVALYFLVPTLELEHEAGVGAPLENLYQQAEQKLAEGSDVDQAISLYRQILSERADARAYLGLARAKLAKISPHEIPAHADELVGLLERVVQEDPNLGEARWLLGMIYFYGRWDFQAAKETLVEEYNSGNRPPGFLLQFCEVMLALGESGWVERAISELRTDYPEYYAAPTLAWLYLLLGEEAKAQREISRILDAEPVSYELLVSAQQVAYQAGYEELSWQHLEALMEMADIPEPVLETLRHVYQSEGLAAVHRWLLHNPQSARLGHYRAPVSLARHAVVAGDYSRAISYLRDALEERQWELLWLEVDPHYSPLEQEAEFQALLSDFRRVTRGD